MEIQWEDDELDFSTLRMDAVSVPPGQQMGRLMNRTSLHFPRSPVQMYQHGQKTLIKAANRLSNVSMLSKKVQWISTTLHHLTIRLLAQVTAPEHHNP